jgi:hypothetical protein
VVAQPCEVSWELANSLDSVCGPFVAWGAKGEEEYPYVGWEVLVKSHRSTSRSCTKRGTTTQSGLLGIQYASFISAW